MHTVGQARGALNWPQNVVGRSRSSLRISSKNLRDLCCQRVTETLELLYPTHLILFSWYQNLAFISIKTCPPCALFHIARLLGIVLPWQQHWPWNQVEEPSARYVSVTSGPANLDIESHKSSLPPSFQDPIELTRSLEVPYL